MSHDQGRSPYTGEPAGPPVPHATDAEVDAAGAAAAAAAPGLAALPPEERARLLESVAAALEDARGELVRLADSETGLGEARLGTELTRTRVQLELFAAVVRDGAFHEAVVDHADPAAQPAPRPDLRRMLVPIGPVAVFSASNFPFAFSVAGGDTASALAAGCPVVVKAHSGHPGLSRRTAEVVASAGLPEGAFAVLHGTAAGRRLVQHPAIRAAGFTGSLGGGRALFDLANARPDPIPFYGELGSLNPAVVTPGALAALGPAVVSGFVGSFTLGSGQFCTKPGLLFLPKGHGLDDELAGAVGRAALGPLLNARIRQGYDDVAAALSAVDGVRAIVAPRPVTEPGFRVAPMLLAVSADDLAGRPNELLEECFGPAALVVEYGSPGELAAALDVLPGALTATVHADPATEADLVRDLLDRAAARAGRVVFGGWPTGVAVSWAQQHGGPWPATTNALHTSVGATGIRRWLRPVTFQDVPDAFLPEVLQEANPLGVPRRVDGVQRSHM
ncbi:aldehyde dehydrogenase (NADP(+)) [Spirilliplanes yamanashiensis]|uniref:Aldehyde dehydrogenase n=1 Tax=Spirilliplanes yamanashiensis TaxID=42233 RepID=A0A8J3YBH2_9ACTN|nr:aldehyde dehydrogenase (NADP(+)) [Spirilliplanes yamanashiensis]MDP9819053.1 NADP-dependent aldehyde dehydrogenase [Spirilliplanes yamanashiensis]GIJ05508.1 aldehyde dehydrogenase [Spirilliplanes yamanashiensis]